MLKNCSHKNPIARRTGARLSYPTQTSGHQLCITRKGDPALRLLTNRDRETHLFASFGLPTNASPRTAVGQITRKYRGCQDLGILSQYKHKMLHSNAAQQRPGEKPASAPITSQITPRTQGRAKIPIPTLKHPRN